MKKFTSGLVALACVVALAGCGQTEEAVSSEASVSSEVSTEASVESSVEESVAEESSEESVEEPVAVSDAMTYAEYVAADVDTEVTVETYVQAKQGWWENNGVGVATVYTQNEDGAFFLYNLPMTQDEYDALVAGTKIRVTGYKAVWEGEIEIIDATYSVLDGSYIAAATDVTALLGTDELIEKQNQLVAFNNMTVAAAGQNEAGEDVAFLYKWDGSGADGDDLYFTVSDGNANYTFTVESYLCGAGTEVYEAVKALEIGSTVDMEGFLYWYNGANPHITKVVVK